MSNSIQWLRHACRRGRLLAVLTGPWGEREATKVRVDVMLRALVWHWKEEEPDAGTG